MIALLVTVVAVSSLVIVANEPAAGMAGFVVTVILMGFGCALFVGDSLERRIPISLWDRLSLSRETSRRLGVKLFNTFLSWIGWNRIIFSFRGDEPWNPRHMRAAAAATNAYGPASRAILATVANKGTVRTVAEFPESSEAVATFRY